MHMRDAAFSALQHYIYKYLNKNRYLYVTLSVTLCDAASQNRGRELNIGVLFMVDDQGQKTGIKTATAELYDGEASPVPEPVQEELLPLRKVERGPEAEKRGIRSRGPGRPPGAKNKSTEAWAGYILSRYASPLQALAETYSRPVQDLAAELGCDKLDAFRIQQQAAQALAPYIHKKQPVAVEGDSGLIQLNILSGGNAMQAQDAWAGSVDILNNKNQQNQSLDGQQNREFDAGEFDVDTEGLENGG